MPDNSPSNEAVSTQVLPFAMSDAELERLLDEAASLSQELSEEVGESSNEAPQEEEGGQEEVVAPPADVAEEPEPPEAAGPPTDAAEEREPPSSAEQAKPLPDLLQDPDSPAAAASAEAEPEPTTSEEAAPETSDPPAAPRPSVKIETRDEEIAKEATSPEPAEEESSQSEDAQEDSQEEVRPKGPSIKERLVSACGLAKRFGRAVPIGVANGCLTVMVLIDRPFRSVSPGLKRMLGLIGLATLLAGIITWILPDMMNHNPFAGMELHTKRRG